MPGEQERNRLQEVARVHDLSRQSPPGAVRISVPGWMGHESKLGISSVNSSMEDSRNTSSGQHRYTC